MESHRMHRRLTAVLVAALFAAAGIALVRAQAPEAIYTATYVEARSAAVREAAMLVAQYAADTRRDAGSLRVDALQEVSRPERFLIVSGWSGEPAVAAHQQAAHTLRFRDKLSSIQRAPIDQRTHRGFAVETTPATAGTGAIYVATHVDVPPPRLDEAKTLVNQLVTQIRRDAGHVLYDVYQQTDRPNHFTVFAIWNSRGAFDASGSGGAALQFRSGLGPMLGALYDERLYQSIGR